MNLVKTLDKITLSFYKIKSLKYTELEKGLIVNLFTVDNTTIKSKGYIIIDKVVTGSAKTILTPAFNYRGITYAPVIKNGDNFINIYEDLISTEGRFLKEKDYLTTWLVWPI